MKYAFSSALAHLFVLLCALLCARCTGSSTPNDALDGSEAPLWDGSIAPPDASMSDAAGATDVTRDSRRESLMCGGDPGDYLPIEAGTGHGPFSASELDEIARRNGRLQWKTGLIGTNNVDGKGWCTVTLVDESLAITARHCVSPTPRDRFVFPPSIVTPDDVCRSMLVDFRYQRAGGNGAVRTSSASVFECERVLEYDNPGDLDYVILRLRGAPGRQFGWVRLASNPIEGSIGVMVGHPNGGYKVSTVGRIHRVRPEQLLYGIPSEGGLSGALIYARLPDGRVVPVGLHTGGAPKECIRSLDAQASDDEVKRFSNAGLPIDSVERVSSVLSGVSPPPGAAACGAGMTRCGGACVDTQASTQHCGACDAVCGGAQDCIAGRCVARCVAPSATRCGDACVNVATSTQHCGACGVACRAAPTSVARCEAGTCRSACAAGRGDCDGAGANGCEVDLTTSISHCGACGRRCDLANASARCLSGACRIAACAGGYGDCDLNAANGCERSLGADPANCGRCGVVCARGLRCVDGACR